MLQLLCNTSITLVTNAISNCIPAFPFDPLTHSDTYKFMYRTAGIICEVQFLQAIKFLF